MVLKRWRNSRDNMTTKRPTCFSESPFMSQILIAVVWVLLWIPFAVISQMFPDPIAPWAFLAMLIGTPVWAIWLFSRPLDG
jgi:hypothetical protein